MIIPYIIIVIAIIWVLGTRIILLFRRGLLILIFRFKSNSQRDFNTHSWDIIRILNIFWLARTLDFPDSFVERNFVTNKRIRFGNDDPCFYPDSFEHLFTAILWDTYKPASEFACRGRNQPARPTTFLTNAYPTEKTPIFNLSSGRLCCNRCSRTKRRNYKRRQRSNNSVFLLNRILPKT